MSEEPKSEFERLSEWLSGEVRVSRKLLLAGGVFALILLGIAFD